MLTPGAGEGFWKEAASKDEGNECQLHGIGIPGRRNCRGEK